MLYTVQFQNCPPPPEHFQDIFYFFLSNSPVCWLRTWSNTPPASTSESVKSSTEWSFNNFPMRQTVYSKYEHPAKHSWNILTLRSCFTVVCSLKLLIPEIPHLTGLLKGSQMAQQTLNIGAMRCTCWMRKELRNPFACNVDQNFDMQVKCLTGRSSFCVKLSIVWSKTPVKCPGREDEQFWNCVVDYVRERLVFYPRRGL